MKSLFAVLLTLSLLFAQPKEAGATAGAPSSGYLVGMYGLAASPALVGMVETSINLARSNKKVSFQGITPTLLGSGKVEGMGVRVSLGW